MSSNFQVSEDPYAAGIRLRGSWEDPRIISDIRIDHENPVVRHAAERLHANESMHLHDDINGMVCVYCALRASRCIAWQADYFGSSVDVPLLDASASGGRRLDDATAPASSTGVLS